ncbi:MAG: DUF3618 domain-containing protein [Nocardioidaceae bacterium]
MSQATTPTGHRAQGPASARSPKDLEYEVEETRDRLADTLDELLFRIRPGTIVSRQLRQTKSHFVDAGGNIRTENVAALAGAALGVVVLFAVVRKVSGRKG